MSLRVKAAWGLGAIATLAVGCSVLANNALPEEGSGGAGGMTTSLGGNTGGTTAGTATGTPTGTGGTGGNCDEDETESACFDGIDNDCDGDTDCEDSTCTQATCVADFPAGAEAVVPAVGACPGGYAELAAASCSDCDCQVDDVGTCDYHTSLWDVPDCVGTPVVDAMPLAQDDCYLVTVNAATEVSAATVQVPNYDSSCSDGSTIPSTALTFCRAVATGQCADDGQTCVPSAGQPVCALLADNSPCPASLPTRQVIFPEGSGTCSCVCGPSTQECDLSRHSHTYTDTGCSQDETQLFDGIACTNTGNSEILGINVHDGHWVAASATCEQSASLGNVAPRALCCP